ncbi:hypothetical protein [Arsenicibacter rosenii]|uniref:Uncharacterized protein n=1 Tax=Arsenicibacter rosenii TaxID=1750698 RepID=A0A1S2VM13_9BACT|nr:hypothetical protein [Arsenicibacter rosenii]OIN59794.1 hypothetical protein BLX24_08020 [Arsenicibacter rosenii]
MEQMTLAEAIEKGYDYCLMKGDKNVTELRDVDIEDLAERGAVLCKSDPVFYEINSETLRQIVIDHFSNGESFNDPDREMASAVEDMSLTQYEPLTTLINDAISCYCFYPTLKIELIL